MASVWRGIESVWGWEAVPSVWRRQMGEDFERVRGTLLTPTGRRSGYYPSSGVCACNLRVIQHAADDIVGVSDCGSTGCHDVQLAPSDIAVLELSWRKLARAISTALRCDPRETDIGVPGTRQIGAFSGASMPVVLTVQSSQSGFANAAIKIAWQLGEPFILLAPTNRFLDANAKGALQKARAGFFALDSILKVGANGFYAPKGAGELFSAYLPKDSEPLEEDAARQLFALVKALDSEDVRGVSVLTVFRHYCIDGLSADAIARECGCAKGTVVNRLAAIEKATRTRPEKLRAYSTQFQRVEESLSDSRARRIDRAGALG